MLERRIDHLIVLGDSMLVIHKFHKAKDMVQKKISPLDERIWNQIQKFESISFYYVKRENNKIANEQANIRVCLD